MNTSRLKRHRDYPYDLDCIVYNIYYSVHFKYITDISITSAIIQICTPNKIVNSYRSLDDARLFSLSRSLSLSLLFLFLIFLSDS